MMDLRCLWEKGPLQGVSRVCETIQDWMLRPGVPHVWRCVCVHVHTGRRGRKEEARFVYQQNKDANTP